MIDWRFWRRKKKKFFLEDLKDPKAAKIRKRKEELEEWAGLVLDGKNEEAKQLMIKRSLEMLKEHLDK